jgi:hypothetical protein
VRRRTLVLALWACTIAVAAAAPAFAGRSGAKATDPATAWAGKVCTAVSTWKSALTSAATSVAKQPSAKGIQNGITSAKTVTATFTSTLKTVGKPPGSGATEAKAALTKLSTQLRADVTKLQDTLNSGGGFLKTLSKVSSTVGTIKAEITAAADTIKSLADGHLRNAFNAAPSCKGLTG